jgi:peptide/nickel transport system permease protein
MSTYFLWSDQCLLAVLVVGLYLLLRGLRKEPIRKALISILKKPIAISAAIVLFFFLMIGVLDSIHVSSTSNSLLDRIVSPLGEQYEKTYSAPLALVLYSTETVFTEGHMKQVYPLLNYPKQTIKNEQEKQELITSILLKAVLISLGIVGLLWFIILSIHQYQKIATNRKIIDLRKLFCVSSAEISALLTLFLCLFLLISSYWLSRHLHVLGTGKIGQDIFYYAIKSIRTGLVIGILTTLFMMPLALLLGIAAGFFGGVVDDIIQYIYTTLSSIPGVLLITASVLSMQTYIANHPHQFPTLAQSADARLLALCFILGITSWTSLCRLLRAETLKLREIDFVLAAKALGSSSFKIIWKHLLPNVMHIVVITLVLDFSFLVLAEAVLSYVGVGVSPMTISWGNMINAARLELAREPIVWWPMLAAFIFMFILVLASNLFADAVRDAFDPHQIK